LSRLRDGIMDVNAAIRARNHWLVIAKIRIVIFRIVMAIIVVIDETRHLHLPIDSAMVDFPFGASLARPSVAQELAAQTIGVNSFELPGKPLGVDREIIGQLPSGACVATRKSIPRLISGRSAI
jgi:hypothetical protein